MCAHTFACLAGASHLHVEACVAQVEVMLSHSLSKSNHTAVLQDALKIVEVRTRLCDTVLRILLADPV